MPNFIFVSLSDNDFNVSGALAVVAEGARFLRLDCDEVKRRVIRALLAQELLRFNHPADFGRLVHLDNYLQERLSVHFLLRKPEVDHDGGSAVYNSFTQQIWRI